MKRILFATLLVVGVTSIGCGGGGGGDTEGGSCSALKIINGSTCDTSDSPVALIVGQSRSGAFFSCSGTVVAPTAILTAAHCVYDRKDPVVDLSVGVPGGLAGVSNGTITSIRYDSRYRVLPGGSALYDQAVIRISFDAGISPVPLLGSDSVAINEEITVFGYGVDETGKGALDRLAANDYSSLLKAGKMVVAAFSANRQVFGSSFDITGESACHGDSGGPAIVKRGGMSVVGGIVSYGSSDNCASGSYAVFGNVGNAENLNWIRGQVPEAQLLN
jgi:secreted trypsin-like serine protease